MEEVGYHKGLLVGNGVYKEKLKRAWQGIPEETGTDGRSVNGVLGVHGLKAEYIGPEVVHTGFHIEVAKGTPIEKADRIAEEIRERVSRENGCQQLCYPR